MQIILKLCLQSENCDADIQSLINTNEKEDKCISLGNSKGVKDISEVKRLEVIEKKT